MRIIAYVNGSSGPSFHRVIMPLMLMQNIDVFVTNNLLVEHFEKGCDLFMYNRVLPDHALPIIKELQSRYDFKICVDLDDYWELDEHHILYQEYQRTEFAKKQIAQIIDADVVLVTHARLAEEVAVHNKNVHVCPNAIPKQGQFDIEREPYYLTRLFWQGSDTHREDIALLRTPIDKLGYLAQKIKMVMAGYAEDHEEWHKMVHDYTADLKHQYKLIPYAKITEYYAAYAHADICLVPLINSKFNRHKCIVGDSLVSTTDGVRNIKDIVEGKIPCSVDIDGIHKVVNYFKYSNEHTIKIITDCGYEIEGTPNHRISINGDWIRLDELSVGDKIELSPFQLRAKQYQELTYPMLLSKSITERTVSQSDESMLPKITINERWGRFFGYMLGDGHYTNNGISISCDKRHDDVVQDIIGLYASMGLMPQVINKQPDKRCLTSVVKEGFGVDVKASSRNLLALAKKYNVVSEEGKVFRVPDFILNSPKSVITEFLRGLFEADGSVVSCGMSFCTKALELAKQVQVLLLGYNIKSNILYSYNKHYRRYYYNLKIGRDGSDIFYDQINFISENKRNRLADICSKDHSNAFRAMQMTDKIKEVITGTADVYDIEVENAHCYIANGILNHNSNLKILEAANLGLPVIVSEVHPYLDLPVLYCKHSGDWIKHITRLVGSRKRQREAGQQLAEHVSEHYNFNKINNERKQILEYEGKKNLV